MLACYLWSHECNNFLVDDSFKDFGYNWEKRDGPKVFYKMGVALLWDWDIYHMSHAVYTLVLFTCEKSTQSKWEGLQIADRFK